MRGSNIFWFIPLAAVMAGPLIAIFALWSRTRIRELEIRERIAMIEKGLVPPPEVDPAGFDRAMTTYERAGRPARGLKHGLRRAGITVMGVGLGLFFLIAIAGASVRAGAGVGGFLVIVGLAFLINSAFEPHRDHEPVPPGSTSAPRPPQE